jgi:hypothetical protein
MILEHFFPPSVGYVGYQNRDAGSLYAALNSRSKPVAGVSLAFEKDFLDEAAMNAFLEGHSNLNVVTKSSAEHSERAAVNEALFVFQDRAEFAMPKAIRDAFIRHWREHFQEGRLSFSLADESGQRDLSGSAMASAIDILYEPGTPSRATVSFRLKGKLRQGFVGSLK